MFYRQAGWVIKIWFNIFQAFINNFLKLLEIHRYFYIFYQHWLLSFTKTTPLEVSAHAWVRETCGHIDSLKSALRYEFHQPPLYNTLFKTNHASQIFLKFGVSNRSSTCKYKATLLNYYSFFSKNSFWKNIIIMFLNY